MVVSERKMTMGLNIIKFPYEMADVAITDIFGTDVAPDMAAMPDETTDPELAVHQKDLRRIVRLMLRELDPREELLIRMQYGIDVDEMTMDRIVAQTGIPRGQARGAIVRGMRRLKYRRRGRILRTLL